MSKTVFNIDKNFTLTDSNGRVYTTTVSILERLKALRIGTVIDVKNNYVPLNGDVDNLKTYYIAFDRFGTVMLIYVNLRNRVHKVIAKAEVADFSRDMMQNNSTVQFIGKLHELHGTLRVLNFDDGNKRAYALYRVPVNQWVVNDDGKYGIIGTTAPIKMQYRNLEGKDLQQNWVSLDEAVLQYALRVEKPMTERIAVCTEHGTVVFLL